MPISHLLSESFYLEQDQQQHDYHHHDPITYTASSSRNGPFRSDNNGVTNKSRHVRFDDTFTNNNITFSSADDVHDANHPESHSPHIPGDRFESLSIKDQKIPTTDFESDGLYPYINYEDLKKNTLPTRSVTNKVAWNGYAYTKRGGKGGVSYWYCDQRKICSASLIEKSGVFSAKVDDSSSRSSKRGWGHEGQHETHPPDHNRINKEISTRTRRLEKRKRAQEKRAAKESSNQTETVEVNCESREETEETNDALRIENVWGLCQEDIADSNVPNLDNDSQVIPVLIDTDGGYYDAWALALALKSGNTADNRKFKVVGITTVNGCTTVDNAVQNTGRVLRTIGGNVQNTLVFKGMDSPLLGTKDSTPRPKFFGSDGFGDALPPLSSEQEQQVVPDHGVNAIIKLAEKYKGKLTILALGPLTNLAMAVKLRPEIRNYVKEIFILGGNSEGVGNVTVCSEFNFYADPEAAHVVLENFNACPVYLLPWETCMRSAASSHAFRVNSIGTLNTPLVSLLNQAESKNLSKRGDFWVAPDAVVVACFMNHQVMRKTEHYHCSVELQGKHTRGMTIVDKNFLSQKPANVMLITEVDRQLYEEMLVEAVVSHHNTRGVNSALKLEQNYF